MKEERKMVRVRYHGEIEMVDERWVEDVLMEAVEWCEEVHEGECAEVID